VSLCVSCAASWNLYELITGVGGLFADLNTKGLSTNITANIISDITEPGTNSLNELTYGCSDNYTP
jgi:hypothetical protein